MVEHLMKEPILEQSTDVAVLVNKFWNRKEDKEKIAVEGGFAVYVCINICKANEDVMIFFLFHVFLLIAVMRCPYFHFAPQYEETELYLLAFPHSSCPLSILL